MGALSGLMQTQAALPDPQAAVLPIVRQEASSQGVEAALIMAVIAVESSFRPHVTQTTPSGITSYGLMQLILPTGRDMARNQSLTPQDLFDPALNIRLGTRYLRYQLTRYGNDYTQAIAAYNAGTARTRSDGTFINQGYVDKVVTKLNEYREWERAAAWASQQPALPSDTRPIDLPAIEVHATRPDPLDLPSPTTAGFVGPGGFDVSQWDWMTWLGVGAVGFALLLLLSRR